jgi:alcohol dehydrogenase
MDAAKGGNFILTNGGVMQDYWGIGKATKPLLPFFAIPTTAGTGSECQSFALISDAVSHVKMACGDKKAAAHTALLDPDLSLSQPPRIGALTGIDALTHALESAVSTKSNDISRQYSFASFGLLSRGFFGILNDPPNLHYRSQMLLGAALAGTAIENSMLGAAHAAANPLTASFGIVHGEAVGLMMASVLRLNLVHEPSREIYAELAKMLAIAPDGLPNWWEKTLRGAHLPLRLTERGVTSDAIPDLAIAAAKQWTGTFNPVPMTAAAFEQLYREAL